MDELLKFLITSIIQDKSCPIEKEEDENGNITFTVRPKATEAGILIGKEGRTIKAISQILKIKATLERKRVFIKVEPQTEVNQSSEKEN